MLEAYNRQAYYRSLAHREIGETPFDDTPLTGFPMRQVISDYLWPKWRGHPTPPLVPHGGRAAYEARAVGKQRGRK